MIQYLENEHGDVIWVTRGQQEMRKHPSGHYYTHTPTIYLGRSKGFVIGRFSEVQGGINKVKAYFNKKHGHLCTWTAHPLYDDRIRK